MEKKFSAVLLWTPPGRANSRLLWSDLNDRARLIESLRYGVAQAACELSPVEDAKLREICDLTSRFAESTN